MNNYRALNNMPTQTRCDRVAYPLTTSHDPRQWSRCLDLLATPQDDLPLDPRCWCREDVGKWVERSGGLPERFPMNGKALCLMSCEMFCSRVPNHGPALHRDFRRRLAKALALQEILDNMSKLN